MVFGGDPSSSSNRNIRGDAGGEVCPAKVPHMGDVLGGAHPLPDAPWDHLTYDVLPDADLTRIVVDRRMQYVTSHYSAWSEGLSRVALGVALMSTTEEITMRDMVHFLHLAQENSFPRSHEGQTYLFDNGAFRLFNGVAPESVLQSCAEFAPYVEGCLWSIDKKCSIRDELEIYEALGRLFRAITIASRREETPNGLDAQSADVGVARGTKRRRPWLSIEDAEVHPMSGPLAKREIYNALRDYSLDKWEVRKGYNGSRLKSWGAQEAVNCQSMAKKLATKMENADIVPFYAEYMDMERASTAGFAMGDVCLMYDPHTAAERNGRIMKKVAKSPSNNIYTYISRPLTERLRDESRKRVVEFLQSTFCDNAWALQCTIAGLSLALLGGMLIGHSGLSAVGEWGSPYLRR